MLYTTSSSLSRIRQQITSMRAIPGAMGDELFVPRPEVSGWSAGEHIDHSAKVMRATLAQMAKDEPIDFRGINLTGRVILELGWIPRGRGKSPERLRGAVGTPMELDALLGEARALLDGIEAAPPKEVRRPLVKHPFFGGLNASESLRMLAVHTRHHLKIVAAIAGAAGRPIAMP